MTGAAIIHMPSRMTPGTTSRTRPQAMATLWITLSTTSGQKLG